MDMRALVGKNFARLRREKGLTQEEVEARSGFSQQYLSGLERGKRNPTELTLTYGDGRIAVIKNSRRAVYGYDQRLELLGSEGLLQAHNMLESTVVKSTAAGVTGAKPTYFFLERYMPAYAAEWAAFVGAVNSAKVVPVTLADGIAALAMAEAATLSSKSGEPVKLTDV